MPELCRFFGIIIRMYMEAGEPHHLPHFHAYYQNETAVFSLDPINLIAGSLGRRQRRSLKHGLNCISTSFWLDWQRLQNGQSPLPIAPLD